MAADKVTPTRLAQTLDAGRRLALKHVGYVIGGISFLLVTAKIFIVAGSPTVAYALIGGTDTAHLLISIAVSLVPIVIVPIAVLCLFVTNRGGVEPSPKVTALGFALLGSVLMYAALNTSPLILLETAALGLGIALVVAVVGRLRHRPSAAVAWVLGGTVGVSVAIGVLAMDQPWLPAERIVFKDGRDVVAYIVSEQADWFTLLSRDRYLYTVRIDDVADRYYCIADVQQGLTLPSYLGNTSGLPFCDDPLPTRG